MSPTYVSKNPEETALNAMFTDTLWLNLTLHTTVLLLIQYNQGLNLTLSFSGLHMIYEHKLGK